MRHQRLADIAAARETPPQAYGNLRGPDKAPNTCTGSWTDARVDLLKLLWQDGLSASQIAKQLGGVTRNAVIGKVNRLGLEGRDAPYRPGAPVKTARKAKPVRRLRVAAHGTFEEAEPRPPRVVIPFRDEPPGLCTVMTIRAFGECRWPCGDPLSEDFTFCGRPAPDGRSYCGSHHKRSISPIQPAAKPRAYVARGA